MALVYLGIGANLDPEDNILRGIQRLSEDVTILRLSPWYGSPAIGFDGPAFINLVAEVDTEMAVGELAVVLKVIEQEFGRKKHAIKYSSRALDIDILMYDDLNGVIDGVDLPRSDIWQYAFVLRPLLDLIPWERCPGSGQFLHEYWDGVKEQPLSRCDCESASDQTQNDVTPSSPLKAPLSH
ncbi:MAG: 2-amino-4-hydroxy-6-hydroxymethyldihydropteridine diphosphokinase [Oleibacter sp.]|nr:2-amino-4-hydroxy-6-hydroxymethyldihydropteridine diphosphokinase [Thalassolituus sp.]